MKRLIAFLLFTVSLTNVVAQKHQASWIWYPGDFELWLSSRTQVMRTQRNTPYPPFWRMDRHTPLVEFSKTVELETDETVELRVEGQYYIILDDIRIFEPDITKIQLTKGKHDIKITVHNPETTPALWVKGNTVVSDKTWGVSRFTPDVVKADAWIFDSPDNKPSAYRLAVKPLTPVSITKGDKSTLVDFGSETFGFFILRGLKGNGKLTAWYGESKEEALAGRDAETWDIFPVAQTASADFTSPLSRAFRYINFEYDGDISFDDVSMLYEYNPLTYKGSFRCSDDEINRIWDVSAYTLHLSSREFFLDGIKRDRWLWSGDAYQSYLMNYYLFFDNPLVKRTTWALRGHDPVETHINTILDYSFYWFMGIYDYYLYTGDQEFIQQIYPRMITLMEFCLNRRNADGMVEGLPGDWVFVDWAPISKDGELSVQQLLLCRSLETMALCANIIGDNDKARIYRDIAEKLKVKTMNLFWDPAQKALVHSRKNGKLDATVTKYANMFAMTFGYLTAQQQEDVKNHVLLNDHVQKITTPYMRFYELEALCRIGQQQHVLKEVKDYWGDMLRLGATSFWEAYDPTVSGVQHYEMYGHTFGKSLCHAWGASPIYLLGKYFLGVSPTGPGYQTYLVEPELGGLKWMKGEIPTPSGNIVISVTEKLITIQTVDGTGTLRFKSAKKPSCKTATINKTGPDFYEMELSSYNHYEVKL